MPVWAPSTAVSTSWFLCSRRARAHTAITYNSDSSAATAATSGNTRGRTPSPARATKGSFWLCIRPSSPWPWWPMPLWTAPAVETSCSIPFSEAEPLSSQLSKLVESVTDWSLIPGTWTQLSGGGRPSPANGSCMKLRVGCSRKSRRRLHMSDDTTDKPYEVGFGKPPKGTQFRKGESGNPKGRPKGKPNLATIINRTLQAKVIIKENGRRREVTKYEPGLIQLSNTAAR